MKPGHVEIEIGGMRAVAASPAWIEGDELLLDILRQDLFIRQVSLTYDPFPALTIAQEAIARYGGRIIAQELPEYEEGTVY